MALAMLLASFCGPLGLYAPALATGGPTFTTAPAVGALISTATPITGLQITATGNPTEPVKLQVQHGSLSMTTTTGLTFTGSSSGSTISFSGTVSSLNAALATLQYTGSALGSDTLEASMVAGNQIFNPTNGHLYEYVTSDGNVTWTQAKTLADARTSSGLTGYLATMTSADENSFIAARLTDAAWMGASDAAVEGDWKWVDGPENGTLFYSGLGGSGGHTVGGNYASWNGGEPNNAGNEDCGQFLGGSGLWNDLPCTGAQLPGYVTEYGDDTHHIDVATASVAITTTAATHSVATCTDLQTYGADPNTHFDTFNLTADIDCTGIDFSPLYSGGFSGTLDGHGHKITHLTINRPGDCEVGLFSNTGDATLKNLVLESGAVTGQCDVGALVGYAYNTITVDNVQSRVNVNSTDEEVGGLIGYIDSTNGASVIQNSSVQADVTADWGGGGLIGYAYIESGGSLLVEHSYTTGHLTITNNTGGGLIGYTDVESWSGGASSLTLQNDYSRTDITGPGNPNNLGGLIGTAYHWNDGSTGSTAVTTITRSYASGHITDSGSYIGGLIGYTDSMSGNAGLTISHAFAATPLTTNDPSNTGGLIGYYNLGSNAITSTDNHFDQVAAGTTTCAGQNTLACTAVDTSAQSSYFKNNHVNAPMNAWTFGGIWYTNTGDYPTFVPGDDGDNISAAVEEAAPNAGDANNDGTSDDQQANVSSFVDPVTGHYASVALSSACANTGAGAAAESAKPTQDAGYNYPFGLLSFSADCGTPGFTATVNQYYYGVTLAGFVARKYNATTHGYSTVPGAVLTQATIAGQSVVKVSYQITDGGLLDEDGIANGTIVDPVGPGLLAVGAPNTGLGALSRR